jgi:iron(II)-dependent oxidoreductase
MNEARRLGGAALAAALRESRAITLSRTSNLSDDQWQQVPRQRGVNPIAWELAHVAWFAEFWILRGPHHVGPGNFTLAARPARFAGPDEHFDSARLAHASRWEIALPTRRELDTMLHAQLDACLGALPAGDADEALYFHRLALFHEDMHAEAFAWLRAALGYEAPVACPLPCWGEAGAVPIASGEVIVGRAANGSGFSFDNECQSHPVHLQGFEIDAAPVTAGQFARFVEAGGYENPAWWAGEAGAWRSRSALRHPQRWRLGGQRGAGGGVEGDWQVRWFDRWQALDAGQPVIHVNAWEAEAYCRWAGRRLPTAAEWEHAATSAPPGSFRWGRSVWEWTADAFGPYPGFEPGPYRDYSAPWFGDHRELRGGAFATHERLHDPRYRNFFQPHRTDVFAGFRTVRPD